MARGGFLYIDYEVGEVTGGLKLTANSSYEDAEREVRSHLHLLDSTYSVHFNQLDIRRNKAYTVPRSSWRPQPPAVPAPPVKLPREPVGTTPPQSPPPPTRSASIIEDDAVVPATPTNSDDSSDDHDLGALGQSFPSQEPTGGRETGAKGKRVQSRTLSREQLAREADGEPLLSPRQARASQGAFGSLLAASGSLPTASSSAISPRSSSKTDSRISDAPSPASAFAHPYSADTSSRPQSSQAAPPLPPPHQQALTSSQGSNLSSISATRSELAGRGRHDAPSPFRGSLSGTDEERKEAIRWGKRREEDPPAPAPAAVSPARGPRTSPRRSSVGSDFQIGLVGNEFAFVARSPAFPRGSQAEEGAAQGSSQSYEQGEGVRDVDMEDPSPIESEESAESHIIIKKERQSSPSLFRQPITSGESGSKSNRNRALKHHSSASASGGSTSLDPLPMTDVQARQAILQHARVPPLPLSTAASPRGTKRKEAPTSSTPRHSPRRNPSNSPNKRARLTDSAPAASASTSARPIGRGPSLEENESPRRRAALALKGRPNSLASPSQPRPSTPLTTTKKAPAKSKLATKPRQSLPAVLPSASASASASISTPTASQLIARPSLPPPPSGSRRSSRWGYKIRLPLLPVSPHQSAQRVPQFVFTERSRNGATEGLTLQFVFLAVERVTGWKRKDLRIRCRCGEAAGGGESQESTSQRSASEGGSLGSSSQSEGGVVERMAWGCDEMYIGFRDLEEWGLKSGDIVDVDYIPFDPLRPFDAEE
ncbi:hypothetical protein BCR35DRAFT_349481 [Leucosporidium creatinivorum]|uniref:Uncharacterized protein n=1 Tax=Leucosporidium creatinivorum TaxID=106004 RepID=A0A1Y2G2V1_9BASI|nr:hypothetical protein BCR35DRAFT_349481 [Leucosporidium creatinivorum]